MVTRSDRRQDLPADNRRLRAHHHSQGVGTRGAQGIARGDPTFHIAQKSAPRTARRRVVGRHGQLGGRVRREAPRRNRRPVRRVSSAGKRASMKASVWLIVLGLAMTAGASAGLKPVAFRLASLPASAEQGQKLILCATNVGTGTVDVTLKFINVNTGVMVAEKTVSLAP